jgi:hypothetical protein
MAVANDSRLARAGVAGYNKPKRTPAHPTKSHVVVAKEGDQIKTIRFGQQGVSGSPAKPGESAADKARRKSFKARHAANIAKGKMSAAWWADKVKWAFLPCAFIYASLIWKIILEWV